MTAYRFHLKSRWLIFLAALYFTTVLNLGLWRYFVSHLEVTGINMFFFGISLPILLFAAFYLIFNLILLPYLTNPLLALLLLVSSVNIYFIFNLGILIDS